MTKTPVLTANEVIHGLKKAGLYYIGKQEGAMRYGIILLQKEEQQSPTIPGNDIRKGTLKAILKEADIPLEEFLKLLG